MTNDVVHFHVGIETHITICNVFQEFFPELRAHAKGDDVRIHCF
jgi:hypothetical protein